MIMLFLAGRMHIYVTVIRVIRLTITALCSGYFAGFEAGEVATSTTAHWSTFLWIM